MNKQTIGSLVVIFVLVGGLIWWSKSISSEAPQAEGSSAIAGTQNSLVAEETLYDFGVISMKNGTVSKKFLVKNEGGTDVNLKTVNTSCMCTNAYILSSSGSRKGPFGMPGHGMVPAANEIIKAGESREIEVVYDPNAHGPAGVGMVDRFVYLADDNGNKLQLEIKAKVTP